MINIRSYKRVTSLKVNVQIGYQTLVVMHVSVERY